jgi:hypothetical protein
VKEQGRKNKDYRKIKVRRENNCQKRKIKPKSLYEEKVRNIFGIL